MWHVAVIGPVCSLTPVGERSTLHPVGEFGGRRFADAASDGRPSPSRCAAFDRRGS
jgi:hypothetical protein